ncbi:MAG: response regulator [Acidobacteria bacterium]|nr:response regulator [Acidobacteriota bacterium]
MTDQTRGRVLIVDDDEMITNLLRTVIEPEAEVEVAVNGMDANARLSEHEYDLVFLDLRMPGGSGQTVIDHLRETDADTRPKVIVLSAVANENTRLDESVVTAIIRKPFDPTNIAAIVRRYLSEA